MPAPQPPPFRSVIDSSQMEEVQPVECPFCLERMELEERSAVAWLVCPNGCPTEIEAPAPKPAAAEPTLSSIRPRAAGTA